MNADRELLELAAKAAGYEWDWFGHKFHIAIEHPMWTTWNPLTDDGDALRLAVRLSADVTQHADDLPACVSVTIIGPDSAAPADYAHVVEPHGNDQFAATRRAIVRAAAEIGRNLG